MNKYTFLKFITGYILSLWIMYPLTHLTCFDTNFWKYSFWLSISVFVTILMGTCSKIINSKP